MLEIQSTSRCSFIAKKEILLISMILRKLLRE
jgi:hypothetical protein